MRITLGIDVGGTFTDFAARDDESGQTTVWKCLSVAGDPVAGILEGLSAFDNRERIDAVRLGTTVATNALLERTVAPVAYVTTEGFRDVLFIQRGHRRYHFNMGWNKPKPLVERRHCYEVRERLDKDGAVVTALDEEGVYRVAREISAGGEVKAVAVVLLFSYVNPAHETRIKEIFAEVAPELEISISYDVLPRWKEYERASTTVADAALKPIVGPQMRDVESRLRGSGVDAPISVIRSNGGVMTIDAAAKLPVQLALSGPTGGVLAGRHIAGLIGIDSLVTLDMGGTSTDCATIRGGQESFTTDFEIEWGVPIQIPMIDIRTIGAGGGSIAWIDKGGMLRVGPRSAGSRPGPACYGLGGTEPTVTDANVVLGRINPDNFLGGTMHIDAGAAHEAVGRVAAPLGLSVERAALAIIQIANNNMQGALRSVLIERGLDPRDFTLLAFGGAGPLHVSELMDAAGIPRGVVPNHPGQLSAYGFTLTDARVDRQRTTHLNSAAFDVDRAATVQAQLTAEATAELADQGHLDGIKVLCALEMRYLGQNYELELPVAADAFASGGHATLWDQFHAAHEARFGFKIAGEIIEIVNFLVTAVARAPAPRLRRLAAAPGVPEPVGRRMLHLAEGPVEAPVFDRAALLAGHRIAGPALIEEAASVTVLGPRHDARIDEFGHILIDPKTPA